MNNYGKVFIIFLVIMAFLLISMTAIAIFFFQKEIEKRNAAEEELEKVVSIKSSMEKDLVAAQKDNTFLKQKFSDADERINSLLDELELQEGLREEMKKESASVKDQLDDLRLERDRLKKQLEERTGTHLKDINVLEQQLAAKENAEKELQAKLDSISETNEKLKREVAALAQQIRLSGETVQAMDPAVVEEIAKSIETSKDETPEEPVLPDLVAVPKEVPDGRILNVDKDTEFVIINLGSKDGVKIGDIMSVYRGKDYLGDIKITRVQGEMSAADLIPPFSSRLVRKNDLVTKKE